MADSGKRYSSMPTPIQLDAPDFPDGYEPPRRRSKPALPNFDNAQVDSQRWETRPIPAEIRNLRHEYNDWQDVPEPSPEPRRRIPPPPPHVRPGEIPRRRRHGPPPRGAPRRKRAQSLMPPFVQRILAFRINPLYVTIAGWGVAVIALVAIAGWFVNSLIVDNSYEVFLDGEHIGYMVMRPNDELTSEDFHYYAVRRLGAARGGALVNVTQTVTIAPTRAPVAQRSERADIVGILLRRFDFTFVATAIYVHGERMAVIRTESDLNHLKNLLQERWFHPNGYTVESDFVTGWEEVTIHVPSDFEFDTATVAHLRLDTTRRVMYPYIVQRGDTLNGIALSHDTSFDRIMRDNGRTNHNIFPGEILYIYVNRPLLTVRTIDEFPSESIIEMPTEIVSRPDLRPNQTIVIQHGMNGLQTTIERVTRENGIERSREILEAVVTVAPLPHIIGEGPHEGGIPDVR